MMDDKVTAHNYLAKYLEKYKELRNAEKSEALEDLQTKYQTKEKEAEILLLNKENELSKLRLRNAFNRNLFFGIGLILFGFFSYYLFRQREDIKVKNGIIQTSLNEKETLLKEIHHRVKNNLQVISALLTLQSSHLKDIQAKEALREGQDRVQSMALIHKDLYQHDNLKGVNTKDYLEQLIENLLSSYSVGSQEIEVHTEIQELLLDVDTMIPLGLTINELISNALKHAFEDSEDAKLGIYLKEKGDVLKLRIEDNGIGVEDEDLLKHKSFGYSLVSSFARKLGAELKFHSAGGLRISMDIKNYKKLI